MSPIRTRQQRSQRRWRLQTTDCLKAMRALRANSVDAIVTDPPYGLGFMGKDWDSPGGAGDFPMRRTRETNTVNTGVSHQGGRQRSGRDFVKRQARDAHSFQEWSEAWASEALRVLKPGGHLLAFGGTRTFHRLACALEDAGFEIRDCLMWLYGSGFPKSLNVSQALHRKAEAERKVTSPYTAHGFSEVTPTHDGRHQRTAGDIVDKATNHTAPATSDARRWDGWGTALKPAWEPILMARKPLNGTVAQNVLANETGALNIDGCRIDFASQADERESKAKNRHENFSSAPRQNHIYGRDKRPRHDYTAPGRWPANVLLSHTTECRPLGNRRVRSNSHHPRTRGTGGISTTGHQGQEGPVERTGTHELVRQWQCPPNCPVRILDEQSTNASIQGASRFYYCAKASHTERDAGLEALNNATTDDGRTRPIDNPYLRGKTLRHNIHPTVKPITLMRHLVRLVTPPGGMVLDPFAGSGTTGIAAVLEGARFLGIEREPDYTAIARARIRHWTRRAYRSDTKQSQSR